MELGIFYRDIKLGKTIFENERYVYRANSSAVEKARRKGYSTFIYGFDESFVSDTLPQELELMFPIGSNVDLYEKAGVNQEDSKFVALWKLGKLDLDVPDFYIKSE